MFFKRSKAIKLKNNAKIVVIGGGPAGSFFSYYILKLAKEKKISIDLEIYEGKIFLRSGPKGCNFCAGVLSETLLEKMKEIGITLPLNVAQEAIGSYNMQTRKGEIFLNHPLKLRKIFTVFRGNGPLFSNIKENISFDDFLLKEAQGMGAKIFYKKVTSIEFPKEKGGRLKVITEDMEVEADLVVGAFGLNTDFLEKVNKMRFGYKPPNVLKTCQTELELGEKFVEERFKNSIFILNLGFKDIRFSAIVPKNTFVTITLIGKKDINFSLLDKFLKNENFKKFLPKDFSIPKNYCHCFPKIPVSSSKKPFTDRFVIIGDASVSRYYKNGIESAFITAKFAAETAILDGISKINFKKGYWRRVKKIAYDNFFGRILFFLNDYISRLDFILESHIKIANSENFPSLILKDILWNMFTGNIEYKKIFLKSINPILIGYTIFFAFKNFFKKIFRKDKNG